MFEPLGGESIPCSTNGQRCPENQRSLPERSSGRTVAEADVSESPEGIAELYNRSYSTVSMKPGLVAPIAFDADCWPCCDSGNCMDFPRGWTLFELQKRVDHKIRIDALVQLCLAWHD